MLNKIEVAQLFQENIHSCSEGIKFDITDDGCNVIISFKAPTLKEVEAITKGKIKVGYYSENEVMFMLFKFGDMNWMDAPYSVYLSQNLTKINEIKDGQGLALNIYLIDASTGVLKGIRLVSLPTNFSLKLKSEIEKQKLTPFCNYYSKIGEVYRKYTTKNLVKFATMSWY